MILLDMHMPGTDGFEVCRRLKSDSRTRDVPVIFVSAENRVMDRVRAFSEGAVDYICKPFQDDEALARIQTHLSLRRLQARLVVEKERAEQASLAKSQFLASMSHELRTPLNAVLGYAQILKMSEGLDARQLRGLDAIHEGGEHLLRLINDILDLARIEAGKLQLMPSPASLAGVLRFVSHVIQVRVDPQHVAFRCEKEGELPAAVMVDEKRLSQVLLNLLGNAVKFTARGSVTLTVLSLPDSGGHARLRFTVEDTGSGIAPEDLETIFQPFEQVGPMKQRAGGAGLGLAISRRIVQMMGSDIRVHSEPGAGSRFWFDLRLPLARSGAAASSEGCRRISGYEGPRRTALVVDDVAANRDIVCSVLGMAGFAALEARDGLEALELLSAGSADLVVLDMHMPGLDGPQVLRAIRNDSRLSGLPVIAVSASNFPADLEQALAAGADAFLPKPLDFNRLFDLVAERLKLKWITAPQTQAMLAAQSAAAA
jgi:signal transduction histidine kinase